METLKKYFLAANSCDGFISYFDTAYDPKDNWNAYIIKGGAGTGKSTFMKHIAKESMLRGCKPELCACSSDPDSLDGVIIPEIKTAFFDGTAPHTLEPQYAGACETILNFGEFWDSVKLKEKRKEIIEITDKNKALHKTAAIYLLTAGNLLKDNFVTELRALDLKKVKEFAEKLCKKYIKGRGDGANETVRFLSGISPKGIISFDSTVFKYANKITVISDNYGAASNEILNEIRLYALSKGFEVITFKNPFLTQFTDHLVIPQLRVAFVRECDYIKFNIDARRVHFERFTNQIDLNKKRLKYNRKAASELLNSAVYVLKQANQVHDGLERLYIDCMSYGQLDILGEKIIKEIF